MGKGLLVFKALRGVHWLILLVVAAVGVSGTFVIGQRLEDKVIEGWIQQAELDAAVATIAAQSWLAQSETIISGLALGFKHPEQITEVEFDEMLFKAEEWNSEFSLGAVAVIKRVMRPQRHQIEQSLGRALSDASNPTKTVPDTFDHMVVINSSETEGQLRPSVDLLTMEEMAVVAKTAQRVPDKAIMGPAFTDSEGRIFTLVGISLPNEERDTVIVGRVDLTEMIDVLMVDHAPHGLLLRLSERNTDASAKTIERPIYGSISAADNVLHTTTIPVTRGQVQWNYNWDTTTDYLQGVPTANVTMVQIGGLIITILIVCSIGVLSVQIAVIRNSVEEPTKKLVEEIAGRKKAERIREETERRLSLHLKQTPLAAIDWDKNFKCIAWNPAAEKIFGFSEEEALGKHALDLVVPEEISDQNNAVFNALLNQSGGSHSINENVTKDGRKIIGEWFNTPLKGEEDSAPVGVSSFVQDITESQNAKIKLKESEETFRNFYQIIPDVFMITNLDTGLCIDVNDGFCRVSGYHRDEVIGKYTKQLGLWEDNDDRIRLIRGLKKNGIVNNLAANFYRKDGSLWPGIMSACVVSPGGQSHILSSTKDVSDIRNSEKEAIEANQAKSRFLSSMSHELRTPMNAILGFAQVMEFNSKEPLTESQKTYVDHILKSGNHLMELIKQILELSTIEAGKLSLNFEHTSVRNIIDDSLKIIQMQDDNKDVEIINETAAIDLPLVWTDSTRLVQVMLNLMSNAVKYNREDGTVMLTCEQITEEMLRIRVADTGFGIAKEKQANLFEPFERLGSESGNIQGTGIGLTITKQIIELLRGRIGFESIENKGSVFWVDIPVSNNQKTV